MANDAGFAAAVTIRQSVLSNKLKATYANGSFPSTLSHDLPNGPPDAAIDFFLGEPGITCEGPTNVLVVTVPVWGGVTVTETGNDPVTVQVKGVMEITIEPDFQMVTELDSNGNPILDSNGDPVKVAQLNPLTTINVRTWTATVTSPNPPSDVANYATSDALRARLESAIRTAVLLGAISLPQIPVDYLHGISEFVAENGISSVAVNGALLLGFTGFDASTGPIAGDVTALTDFAGTFDLAAAINPTAAPLFFSEVPETLKKAAADNGATLDESSLKITLGDGVAPVSGTLDATGANLDFSFDILPNLANFSGPGAEWVSYTTEHWVDDPKVRRVKARQWPALWFTTGNASSGVDPSWWTYVVDVVTAGFALLYFLPKFSNSESDFDNKVDDHPPNAPYSRVQRSVAADGFVLRTALDSFDIKTDGITVGVHVTAKPATIAVTGPAIIPSNYANELLHYALRLPSGALSSDPTLRVAWTLTDAISHATLTTQDNSVTDATPAFEFKPSSFASSSQFAIQARLYRQFGTQAVDVGTASTTLRVRGALAANAYVAWRAQSVKPTVVFDTTSGGWTYNGDVHVQRHSKWHRTDAPCQAAAKGAYYAGRYQPRFANTLPFALELLDQYRVTLCDYCFFGGPGGKNARF